jgi:transcriptional regulator with XRE-family HTH domain
MSDPLIRVLRDTRRGRRVTQQDIARAVGVTRTQVTNLEAGRSDVPLSRVRAWCDVLGLVLVAIPRELLDPQQDTTLP